jgi:ketosteroid isomerase-like protein
MADAVRAILEQLFATCSAGDVDRAVSLFAADGVLVDPHYPYPHMRGTDAIRDGLTSGIGGMRSMAFTIERFFPGDDGASGAAEVATHHVLKAGKKLDFSQVFVIETADGQIRRLQAYAPYRTNGVLGAMLKVGHGVHRLRSRGRSVDR